MININIFITSLKLTWIRRLLIKDSEWSNLLTETTHCKITHLFQCGADYPRQKAHFAELISIVQHENTQTLFETLWYNDKIQIQNKSGFFYKTIYENGFYLISDLLDKNGDLMKFDDFKNKINKLPLTLYEGLKKENTKILAGCQKYCS